MIHAAELSLGFKHHPRFTTRALSIALGQILRTPLIRYAKSTFRMK
jgi:hypothetical protein